MKKIFVFTLLYFGIFVSAKADSKSSYTYNLSSDTTFLPQILVLPLSSYIGKPVDSLLTVLPGGYSDRGFMPYGAGYNKGVFQSYSTDYSNNCFVEIYIDSYQYLPIPNKTPTTSWNMDLAKLETIAFIKVWKNNKICVFGCNNPNYFH